MQSSLAGERNAYVAYDVNAMREYEYDYECWKMRRTTLTSFLVAAHYVGCGAKMTSVLAKDVGEEGAQCHPVESTCMESRWGWRRR